ncbi:MAG: alpha/beta fold hydrolase [Rhizobium sp.]|nr:alpha/beta fold hydrolase [Rhizobium sp.]
MKDQFIAVDGVRIRYRESAGSGVPVLLTHGIGGSLEMWHEQLSRLGGSLRLIAWDLPGHGLSDLGKQPYDPDTFSAFAWRFVDALKLDRLVLVGNSLGGAISLRMADSQPDRVAGLLLANAAGLGKETPLPFRLMTLPLLGEMLSKPGPIAVEQQLKAIFHDQSVVSEHVRAFVTRNVHREGGSQAFVATLRRMTRLSGQKSDLVEQSLAIIRRLQLPIFFLHGLQDGVLPFKHSAEASKLASHRGLFLIENCGHTPQIEVPDQFNRILLDLVGSNVADDAVGAASSDMGGALTH